MVKALKILIFLTLLTGARTCLMAKGADSTKWRPTFGLEYTGELQTNFRKAKNVNLLMLRAELPITKRFTFNIASVSTASTDELPLFLDLQGYSNIETFNIPFALAVAGLTWHINDHHSLFAGIRRTDEDYFCSDTFAFFTNSSCGSLPTLSGNYLFPIYPLAAMGLHYAYDSERLGVQASFYNGQGAYEFTGSSNVFRFCPKSDGIFALGQVEYRYRDSHYFLGASVHDHNLYNMEERKLRPSIWLLAEQSLFPRFTLLAAYSHAFSSVELCRNFCGLGAKYDFKKVELGFFSDYTRMLDIDEWATELTCKVALSKYLSVQPVLHILNTDGETQCIGVLRLNVSL